jgi:hypothetical protein
MTQCSRSRPSQADGVVRVAAGGGRTFAVCRGHRPRRPVGPFRLSGPAPASGPGHRSFRIEARADARGARTPDRRGRRPTSVEAARTRTTTTSGRRRRTDRGLEPLRLAVIELRPEPRTAVAALASLAAHPDPAGGRARR